uniref:S-ribosylhomocysteine lyase n=1 Tax=Lygus hesperus TaxID=30085 RepID=A0A0A9YPK5_LYGHE
MYKLREPPVPAQLPLFDTYTNMHSILPAPATSSATGMPYSNTDGITTSKTVLVATSLHGCFVKVSEMQLGRSGVRLTLPSAQMVVDSGGTALFIAALMRDKVVVPLQRTNNTVTKNIFDGGGRSNDYDESNSGILSRIHNGFEQSKRSDNNSVVTGKEQWYRFQERQKR